MLVVGGTDVSQEASENAAMFLLQHFQNSDQVTAVDTKILKSNFGPFPASNAEKCFEIVHKLLGLLPNGVLNKENDPSLLNAKRYGHKLKVNVVDEEGFNQDDSDSDSEAEKGDSFVNQFKEVMNLDQSKLSHDITNVPAKRNSSEATQNQELDTESSWLLNQCQIYFPGHESPETMATALYDVLISTRNDAELQNELFELVGFEAFDFIGELLKRRSKLISLQDTIGAGKFRDLSKKPHFASQVTIQVRHASNCYIMLNFLKLF